MPHRYLIDIAIDIARQLVRMLPLFVVIAILAVAVLMAHGRSSATEPLDILSRVGQWAVPLFSSAFAVGFVVMALIQLVKPSLRAEFHFRQVRTWLMNPRHHPVARFRSGRANSKDASWRFLWDIGEANPNALLALPLEQLTAQIQAAADSRLVQGPEGTEFVISIIGDPSARMPPGASDSDPRSWLARQVQIRLDALQIQARHAWQRYLRILATLVSTTLVALIALLFGQWQVDTLATLFFVLLVGVLGGFFASLARDIVAFIERARR